MMFIELGKHINKIIITRKLIDNALKESNNMWINKLYSKKVFKMIYILISLYSTIHYNLIFVCYYFLWLDIYLKKKK